MIRVMLGMTSSSVQNRDDTDTFAIWVSYNSVACASNLEDEVLPAEGLHRPNAQSGFLDVGGHMTRLVLG